MRECLRKIRERTQQSQPNLLRGAIAAVAAGILFLGGCGWLLDSFSAFPNSGDCPLTVQFSPRSTARVRGWYWEFGDGATSDSQNPTHTYVFPGRYTVSLTITYTMAAGQEASYTASETACVVVEGAWPTVSGKLYVTNQGNNTISRANLDGTDGESLVIPPGILNGPIDIDVDMIRGKMYVIDSNHVAVANLDGSDWRGLGTLGGALLPGGIMSIAVDATHGKMYVLENHNTVVRANLDGTGGENLGNLNGTLDTTHSIALDVAQGKMYVTNGGGNSVSRADLDGTNAEDLGNLNGTIGPYDIALDLVHGKMYVLTAYSTIVRANLDGTGAETLGSEWRVLGPSGIALDVPRMRMYVVCSSSNSVVTADLDGTNVLNLGSLNDTLNMAWRIAIVPAD